MTEQDVLQEMQKPIMVALDSLNWFLLLSMMDQVLKLDDFFATEQDREAVRKTATSIHNQVFNKEDKSLIDMLTVKPKNIITKPDLIV